MTVRYSLTYSTNSSRLFTEKSNFNPSDEAIQVIRSNIVYHSEYLILG